MTYRSSPAFAIGMVKPAFACLICGAEVATRPINEVRGVCEAHCYDHDYQHDGWAGKACVHCGAEPPDDYYYSEDDVGFGPLYVPGEPRGIPASAMNGNVSARSEDPAAWDRWVAFCNANGLP